MHIELSFDTVLDLHFLFTGRFPMSLKDEIGRQKNKIYSTLTQDPERADMLSAEREIDAGGRRFLVLFASDKRQVDTYSDVRRLKVVDIIEIPRK